MSSLGARILAEAEAETGSDLESLCDSDKVFLFDEAMADLGPSPNSVSVKQKKKPAQKKTAPSGDALTADEVAKIQQGVKQRLAARRLRARAKRLYPCTPRNVRVPSRRGSSSSSRSVAVVPVAVPVEPVAVAVVPVAPRYPAKVNNETVVSEANTFQAPPFPFGDLHDHCRYLEWDHKRPRTVDMLHSDLISSKVATQGVYVPGTKMLQDPYLNILFIWDKGGSTYCTARFQHRRAELEAHVQKYQTQARLKALNAGRAAYLAQMRAGVSEPRAISHAIATRRSIRIAAMDKAQMKAETEVDRQWRRRLAKEKLTLRPWHVKQKNSKRKREESEEEEEEE
ncbi:unknown protein [Seminavis robusta]|uniref:Uncharacterized protein n=1 Tax=Seminavis robusta TaxID=568900 RepID=A0A9N8EUV7_9STRA|nr:unknown protein [Seminavis robusta]|eukprot:Sro2275_g321620.1 n/a (341) ;mRNA; f:1861-3065